MDKKFIKCEHCGKKIYFGDTVYYDTYGDICCCSAECYIALSGKMDKLDEELAERYLWEICDDVTIAKRKAEIERDIEKLQKELKMLEA